MSKIEPKRIRQVQEIAIVNRMVTGGMNHAYQRVVAQIEVKLVEAVDETDDYKRGLQDAKALASSLIRIIE